LFQAICSKWPVNKEYFLYDGRIRLVDPTGCDCHVRQNGRSGFRIERSFSLTVVHERRDFRVIKPTHLPMSRDHFVRSVRESCLLRWYNAVNTVGWLARNEKLRGPRISRDC